MKTYIRQIGVILIGCLSVFSCDEIEILPPPDTGGTIEKKGTGNSDARSILFVKNDTTSLFVDPLSNETYVVSNDPLNYFTNDQFAKPYPSDPLNFYLDVFPTLKTNLVMTLQPAEQNLETSEYPGAFGEEIDPRWYVDSNWWQLNAQHIDYQFDAGNATVVEGDITNNTTWYSNKQYLLRGQVFVKAGVTLTIEPGTVIFGEQGVGDTSGVLCFNRGAKINANGTADNPIVFTSTYSPGERSRGQWGGVVFCGKAITNKGDNVLIEGINGGDSEDGVYGGNDDQDSSGSFSFWRVEYAGVALSPGNEINSITLGGVGSETDIHHIIISAAGDDSIEWFGGTSNLKFIVTFNTLDDDLDMDAGYSGTLQYVYVVRNANVADESGSAVIEASSSKSVGTLPQTKAVVSNLTLVGPVYQFNNTDFIYDPKFQGGLYSKEDAQVKVINSVFVGCPVGIQNP